MCSSSNSSYNLTDSSLITVGYQLYFFGFNCTRSADLACICIVLLPTGNRVQSVTVLLSLQIRNMQTIVIAIVPEGFTLYYSASLPRARMRCKG